MLDDDLFEIQTPRKKATRREKRLTRQKFGLVRAKDQRPNEELPADLSREELQKLQEADESRNDARESAKDPTQPFFRVNGLLYRRWQSRAARDLGGDEGVSQLVLPQECIHRVLQLAHSVPMSGHLGKKKTTARVAQRFYWPTMHRDIAEYCRGCAACQKCRKFKSTCAPMVPLPIIGEPFSRIAMDMVGPLPRSRSGNKYVLVLCDYATRYPKAIPLKNTDAETVAEELLALFSRVGIPNEILTDQGSNFQSQLLKELYRLLRVDAIRTSPYHPQTDGLVERSDPKSYAEEDSIRGRQGLG